jgi:DNA-directed RNA polymerase subunit omega
MRLEQIIAKALKNVDNDRYILSLAVGQRADELSRGAKPLIPDLRDIKYTDIAIMELAEGLLKVEGVVEK